jgi:P-type Mg2+ transporter
MLGEVLNATLIAAMVVLSVGLNFVQVYRSGQAAHKLRSLAAPTTTVWRDGRPIEVPVRDVVPGDLLEVRANQCLRTIRLYERCAQGETQCQNGRTN